MTTKVKVTFKLKGVFCHPKCDNVICNCLCLMGQLCLITLMLTLVIKKKSLVTNLLLANREGNWKIVDKTSTKSVHENVKIVVQTWNIPAFVTVVPSSLPTDTSQSEEKNVSYKYIKWQPHIKFHHLIYRVLQLDDLTSWILTFPNSEKCWKKLNRKRCYF